MDWTRRLLRDTVFGLEDGLISTLGALTGIAAGTQAKSVVVLSGLVIVSVESLAMAAGSFLSSRSVQEYEDHLLKAERRAIEEDPARECRALRPLYAERGFSPAEIALLEKRLLGNPAFLLEEIAHKRLHLAPEDKEASGLNAAAMGASYVLGGAVPLLPYLVLPVHAAMAASVLVALASLFLLGAGKGRLVGRAWARSGAEMLAVAGMADLLGYAVGHWARRLA